MSMVIYKYNLNPSGVILPKGAKVLTCAMQGENLCLWCLVDLKAGFETRFFLIYGTGHEVHDAENSKYLTTVFQKEFVWHIFEYIPEVMNDIDRSN